MLRGCGLVMIASVIACGPRVLLAQSCEKLAKSSSPPVTITTAEPVTGGNFTASGSADTFSGLPSFCRVVANLKPTSDSDIHSEIWLPISDWNGKFMAVGSGGWGGYFSYEEMTEALQRGYAVSSTDDGHRDRGSAKFIVGHPEKFVD